MAEDGVSVQPIQQLDACSSSDNSLDRRACRICQSETGVMLRPCGCTGTVGDIHVSCLNQWVNVSQKKACEICNEEYRQSGSEYKRLKDWSRPRYEWREFMVTGLFFGLFCCIIYMVWLFRERKFIERCWTREMPMRSDDMARIGVFSVFFMLFMANLFSALSGIGHYFSNQKEIHFVNKGGQ